MPISSLTPSQLYISEEKLASVLSWFHGDLSAMDPVPLKRLAGRTLMLDGHTRAVAAYMAGLFEIPCVWESGEWDWAAYAADISVCAEEGVDSVAALARRIVPEDGYKRLWEDRCDAILRERYYDILRQRDEVIFYTVSPSGLPHDLDIRPYDPGFDDGEYFMLYDQGVPAAMGSIERYSFEFWEASSVRAMPGFRRRGFGQAITAFLTDRIVSSGKTATCRTRPDNEGMNRIIEKCGYHKLYSDN